MARIRLLAHQTEAAHELGRIGCDEMGIELMKAKAIHRVVVLNDVDPRAANVLKQEMLSIGGEAAVSRGTIDSTVKRTDVVLMGTLKQYMQLRAKLKLQPWGLKDVAAAIRDVLSNFEAACRMKAGEHTLRFGKRTYVMGILNLTPDSFSGDGITDVAHAVARAKAMVKAGADIIDIGGESTRPISEPVPSKEETARIAPVLKELVKIVRVPISIDSYKPEVVGTALALGASIINDISGLRDERMLELAARHNVPVVIMHMKGTPQDMQHSPEYEDAIGDIYRFLERQVGTALRAGLKKSNIIIDPGIGFGKRVEDNLEIIKRLREFRSLGCAVLIGPSRKSFMGEVLDLPVDERLEGTLGAVALCVANGADIVRVHDVKETKRVCRLVDAIVR